MTLQSSGQISFLNVITEINEAQGTSISENISMSGLIDETFGPWQSAPDQATPYLLSDFYGLTASSG